LTFNNIFEIPKLIGEKEHERISKKWKVEKAKKERRFQESNLDTRSRKHRCRHAK
jgi:hypothetical protein